MPAPTIDIACLCAAWCRLCDDYRSVIAQVQRDLDPAGAAALRWHWIDIEDEAELVGDVDVETFPTLVIVDDERVRFAGTIEPQPDTLRRLLRAAAIDAAPGAHWPAVPHEVEAFAARLRSRAAAA
jgi:thioredoxin 1